MNPRVRTFLIGGVAIVGALVVMAAISSWVQPELVTVKTGDVVVCTAGEIVEDNTEEIEVPPSDVAKYSVTMSTITCPDHQGASTLYDEAQAAIAKGDLTTAAEKLKQVAVGDPAYKKASEQLKEIESGKKPTADADSSDGDDEPDSPAPDEPTDAVFNLTKYVPNRIPGFSAQGVIADPASITRNYLPTSGKADLLVVMAEQTVDAKNAADTIATLKTVYPTSSGSVSVDGKKAYFGVRDQLAVILVADGPVVVTIEMHAKKGSGAPLKDALLKAAKTVMQG